VCFEVKFGGVKRWRYFNGGRYMIPDLRSSRGESTTSTDEINNHHWYSDIVITTQKAETKESDAAIYTPHNASLRLYCSSR